MTFLNDREYDFMNRAKCGSGSTCISKLYCMITVCNRKSNLIGD